MKVLIIGAGAVSEMFHIPACIQLLGKENVFIAEPELFRKEKLMESFGLINFTDDFNEFLPNVDFAIIATPPHIHKKIIFDCIDVGIPVLCEKPAVVTSEDSCLILHHNKLKNIPIGICHTYRLFPNRIYLKRLIAENYFGDEININIQEGDPINWPSVSGYNFRKEIVPGGVLLDAGIHSLDFILWCLGVPSIVSYYDDAVGGIESNARLNLEYKTNVKASFSISRTCTLNNKIKLTGSKGSAELDIFDMNNIKVNSIETNTHISIKLDWTNIGKYQIENFINSFKEKREPFCSLAEAHEGIKLIEQCYSIKRARPLPKKAIIPGIKF